MAVLVARPDENVRGWGGFVRVLVGWALGLFALGVAVLLAVDPYDSGRTGLSRLRGLHEQFPYTANASRARDPRFDSAVFGNSHIQALNPERLASLTGLRIVSLAMPATYTRDVLDMLRWYLIAHEAQPRAILVGLDPFWCMSAEQSNELRFPAWLYSPNPLVYFAGLVRYRSFEAAQKRIAFLLTGKKGLRPDGYWYYGPMYAQMGLDQSEPSYRKLAERRPFPVNPTETFPALDRLQEELGRVPPSTAIVLVRTPFYRTALPEPGSAEARSELACRTRMEAVAASRPRTTFLDLFKHGPAADDRDNFFDHGHFRDRLAPEIERSVAASLAALGIAPRGSPAAGPSGSH
jgi:hypothetical protein